MEKRLRKCTSPLNHSGVVIDEGISEHRGAPLLSVTAITSVQALPSARAFAPTLTALLSPAVLGGPGRCETPSATVPVFTLQQLARGGILSHSTAHEGRRVLVGMWAKGGAPGFGGNDMSS